MKYLPQLLICVFCVYVQRDILANTCGSAVYNSFLDSLGSTIDLATHRGFDGR